jgi:ubiquinol-cytochrome c reductase cytochrome b subunit
MIKKFNIKTPSNIYIWWNFGSLISIYITIQIIIGLIIAINYIITNNPFISSFFIYYNINFGWIIRIFHRNITSIIFILIIIHLKRNINFNTFINKNIWIRGIIIIILFIIISFLGYSLIWTQISYWGIIVITNFISTIPLIGKILLNWIWGNFNINITLINRFFIIHFLTPIILILIIIIHINILHLNKSSNPLGINKKIDLITLNPYSLIKDVIIIILIIILFINLNFFYPIILNNFDNFNEINYFITPNHIEPEWYFLFFYSILRSIPNKLRGLIIIFLSIIFFIIFPWNHNLNIQNNKFIYLNNYINKIFFFIIIFISILGSKIIEYPYENLNFYLIIIIFSYFLYNLIYKLVKNLFWK